ncbi:MAG: glutamyl-tRNA reductase [Gammaproteobacteria bacterium]|nr:glutamyl-tRNA reductase [Gammaproteobacteria bacterium]
MPLQILGINHKTAPVDIRESVVIPESRVSDALTNLNAQEGVNAGIIVSTCNRTEVYCETEFDQPDPLVQWLATYHGLQTRALEKYIYHYEQESAVHHALRVASGLDSMVLGEPQILGQLKAAYQASCDAGTLGLHLDRLFQHTFSVAKQVRSETSIGSSPVSIAYAAVTLAKQIFSDLSEQTTLLIGAGETIELVARHLHNNGIGRIIVANRSYERAHNLAKQYDGYAIELKEIPSHLAEADIVISSTASDDPIVMYEQAKQAVKIRRHRPILMVDIAVPRDIDPKIAQLEDIYLYSVDDMHDIIQENMKSREAAASEAEDIISDHVHQFMGWIRTRDAVPTIRCIRDWAEEIKGETLKKAHRQLSQGKDTSEILDQLAHNLTNKLIHNPSSRLREAGFHQEEDIIEAARVLFNLDKQPEK